MKNKNNYSWVLIFIFLLIIIPSKSAHAQAHAQFGNNFCFHHTSVDPRLMVKQPGIFMVSDTLLENAIKNFKPIEYAKLKMPDVKTLQLTIEDSLIDINIDSIYYNDNTIDLFGYGEPKSPIILGVKLNPTLENWYTSDVNSISKSYSCYMINDSSEAILIALGITTDNVSEYKYHVVENDSVEIIPWSSIPKLEQKYGAVRPYAFLGKYCAPGKQLLVEISNNNNYGIRDGVIFDWRVNYKPIVTQIIVSTPTGFFNLKSKKLNRNYASLFDSVTGMPLNLKFPVDSINNFRFNFKNHPNIPYVMFLKQTIHGETKTKQIDYWVLKNNYDFTKDNFSAPGKYELLIQRAQKLNHYGEENILRFSFEVYEPDLGDKTFTARQIMLYAAALLLIIAITFLLYYLKNKRKFTKTVRSKEKAELRLKSIRAQLNPHFIFNALSSIQNLMDRKEISSANHYLSIFSSLTRAVLNTGQQELISLEDELMLLDNYLKMEQLRFGFQYNIKIENELNSANIEIPAMLLQPMVENAVKHGISGLREKGVLNVSINKTDQSLILSVIDNGKGFDESLAVKESSGLGIKLSKERISLLNKIFHEQSISIVFDSGERGTRVTLTLKDWL